MITYELSITGMLASYMPAGYQRSHDTLESANAEYKRVLESVADPESPSRDLGTIREVHNGMIYGSDGSEYRASITGPAVRG